MTALFEAFLRISLVFVAALVGVVNAEACRSQCYIQQHPKCGIDLEDSSVEANEGIYQIRDGLINLKCSFKSRPTPVQVHWKYRPRSDTKFRDIPCGNQRKNEECNFDGSGAHLTMAACSVPTKWLNLTGMYRCEATQESGTFLASSQANVEVIGIESVDRKGADLRHGAHGFVEVEVCANPKPEFHWLLPDGQVLQPLESRDQYSVSAILPAYSSSADTEEPSKVLPYCYRNRLMIGKVGRMDHSIALYLINEGESKLYGLDLRVRQLPLRSSVATALQLGTGRLSVIFVVLALTIMKLLE
ncbi:Protein ZIG-9 [Aphelenchoides avenae]|nr:Protein ZIG-9 [Aphelenchus avenae]